MLALLRNLAIAALATTVFSPFVADAGTFTTLYRFIGDTDGGNPTGPLLFNGGELYGTLPAYSADENYMGNIYKVGASNGAYKVVYAFKGGADGSGPVNGVIYQDGTLYGTTYFGGGGCLSQGCGTIFSMDVKTGAERVLYSFSHDQGNSPVGAGGLIYLAGTLYGTTQAGGKTGKGSVFSFNPATNSYSILFSFTGGPDGNWPNPELLSQNGLIYGTTQFGGAGCTHASPTGCGTIFTLNPANAAQTVLHKFSAGAGGKYPASNLIYRRGQLAGDTALGGDRQSCRRGCGVSFLVKALDGHETVLNQFATLEQSYSAQTLVNGTVYETLPNGGSGNGALVQVDLKSGQQTVLYIFTGGTDGKYPMAPLTYHGGAIYGTTMSGGNGECEANQGCGTVFKFVP